MNSLPQEKREQLMELQERMMELSTKQKQTVMQAQNKMKDKRQNVFVLSELNELPEETKTYQAVGKMFVLRDKTTVEDELIEANSKIDTDVAGLEKSKEYFDSKLDEVKSGLKDLIGSVPGLAAK
eukprot:PRCOL_00006384-RA